MPNRDRFVAVKVNDVPSILDRNTKKVAPFDIGDDAYRNPVMEDLNRGNREIYDYWWAAHHSDIDPDDY